MSTLAQSQVHVRGGLRCGYCHDDLHPDTDDWVACSDCLARHHRDCWVGGCATCQCEAFLDAARPTTSTRPRPMRDADDVGRLSVGRAMREGLRLYSPAVFAVFFVAVLAANAISTATLLLLGGLMSGGLWRMGLAAMRGEKVRFTDLFSATDRFLPLTVSVFLVMILDLIGTLALLVPAIVLGAGLAYSTGLILEQNLGWLESWRASWRAVKRSGWKPHLALSALTTVVALPGTLAGLIVPFASALWIALVFPIVIGPWFSAYRQVFDEDARETGKQA